MRTSFIRHAVSFVSSKSMLNFRFLPGAMAFLLSITPVPAAAQPVTTGQIVISGTVPDEATKAALLTRLQDVYGAGRVDDRISVGGVTAPADWSGLVPKLSPPPRKSVSKGQLTVEGATVSLRGEVASETVRQAVASTVARTLTPAFVVKNSLRVGAQNQGIIDGALNSRIIEFEPGSALLTDSGKRILDEIAVTLKKIDANKFEVIGHTDNMGPPAFNLALSRSRAESVKTHLVARGLRSESIGISGMGADQPMVSNATDEGRRRNRRIEFRTSQ